MLVVVNIAFPYNKIDADAMQDSLQVLRGIAEKGNQYIRACHSHLTKIKETVNLNCQDLGSGRASCQDMATTLTNTMSHDSVPDNNHDNLNETDKSETRVDVTAWAGPPPQQEDNSCGSQAQEHEVQPEGISAFGSDNVLGGPIPSVPTASTANVHYPPTPSPAGDLWSEVLQSIDIDMDRNWLESTLSDSWSMDPRRMPGS